MRRVGYVIGAWIGIVCGASRADAQDTVMVAPVDVRVTDGKLTSKSTAVDTPVGDGPVSLSVMCVANGGANCANLQAWLAVDPAAPRHQLTAVLRTAQAIRWVFDGKDVPSQKTPLRISVDTSAGIVVANLTRETASDEPLDKVKLATLLARDCSPQRPRVLQNLGIVTPDPAPGARPTRAYGRILVSPTGAIHSQPPQHFNDQMDLEVLVLMDPRLDPIFSVVRSSPIRTVGQLNIAGQDATISSAQISKLQGKQPVQPCIPASRFAFDFGSGKGTVDLQVQLSDGSVAKTGSFEIAVNPTYTGALSMGVLRTALAAPSFGLAWNGTDSVIVEKKGGPRTLYVMFYTPFVWGPRDFTLSDVSLNPTIGLILNDIGKNAVVGGTIDWGGSIFLTAGVHGAEMTELDPASKLGVGSKFDKPSTAIPTRSHLHGGWFFAASVDLRAAAALLKAALGSATSGS